MKSILLSFILFCAFTGSALAVQSIDQPFSKLKLTDGRVLENARLKAFDSDSVFVRDDDGFVQVPYRLFPAELQPQLAKARAAAAPTGTAPYHGSMAPPRPVAARPAAKMIPPFPYEPLGVANGGFLELVCFYDHVQELFGPGTWVRVLQWGATDDDGAVAGRSVVIFEVKEQLWAWDISLGFIPLDMPLESREDIAQVVAAISAKYPGIVAGSPYYRYDNSPPQPEANIPEVMATSDVAAYRDATLAGARLGAQRPVNVVQFSLGENQPSAAAVFDFGGHLYVYFPDLGTIRFISQRKGIADMRLLVRAFRRIFPTASALKSLNYGASAPVSADGQN